MPDQGFIGSLQFRGVNNRLGLKMNELFGVGMLWQGVFPRSLHRLTHRLTDVGKGSASHLTGQIFFAEFLVSASEGTDIAAKRRHFRGEFGYGRPVILI